MAKSETNDNADDELRAGVIKAPKERFGDSLTVRARPPRQSYYKRSDGARCAWTIEKDSDGYFWALLYRPTGKGSRSGKAAVRKQLHKEGVQFTLAKQSKRCKRKDAQAVALAWCLEYEIPQIEATLLSVPSASRAQGGISMQADRF